MTVDEFVAWSRDLPGRYELQDGEVVVLPAERVEHAEVKFEIQQRLSRALVAAGSLCRVLPDGMNVRIDAQTALEPDALVYCGERLRRGSKEVPNPVIVVEVTSPSTAVRDETAKVIGYFSLPSVMHYLIISPEKPQHLHFARGADGRIVVDIRSGGEIVMTPPGLALSLDHLLD